MGYHKCINRPARKPLTVSTNEIASQIQYIYKYHLASKKHTHTGQYARALFLKKQISEICPENTTNTTSAFIGK